MPCMTLGRAASVRDNQLRDEALVALAHRAEGSVVMSELGGPPDR